MSAPQQGGGTQEQEGSASQMGSRTAIPSNWKTRPILIQRNSSQIIKPCLSANLGGVSSHCGESSSSIITSSSITSSSPASSIPTSSSIISSCSEPPGMGPSDTTSSCLGLVSLFKSQSGNLGAPKDSLNIE